MKINHLAMWVNDLEITRIFYVKYFNASCNKKYVNSVKGFKSYFLTFEDGFRLEIMSMQSVEKLPGKSELDYEGFCHLAFSAGTEDAVDSLTQRLESDGFVIASQPRRTGDGYYESVVLDPEGNRVEITV